MSAVASAVQSPLRVWLEREGALLRLRLSRPKANIIDGEMIAALAAAFDAYRTHGRVLAALIDHEGPNFSFGASVEEHLPECCEEMLASLHALLVRMLEWPQPILVCARGQCLGGGLELALAASQLFVAPQARLGQPEIKLGVIAPAASVLLPLRIGQARAEDLLFSGRTIAGTTAVAWGLAAEAAEEPETAALIYFDKHFADKSAAALACAVHAARAPFAELARARLDEMEAYYLQAVMATRDAHEGLAAFIAKRPPVWEHR